MVKTIEKTTENPSVPQTNKTSFGSIMGKFSSVLVLVILIIFMTLNSGNFFRASNFINILKQSSVVGILAIGQTLVILTNGIDLSVGVTMALSGCMIAVASAQWHLNPLVALILGVIICIAVGVVNGLVITKLKVQPFIATLGSSTALTGAALLLTGGLPISGINSSLLVIGSGNLGVIPISIVAFFAIAAVAYILHKYTNIGRNVVAIGGNVEAARVSGIKIDRTLIYVYGFAGICSGLASLAMIGRLNSADATMGTGLELQSIAAVVLGGTSMMGGNGSIIGTIIGVFTIGVLNDGLDLMNVSDFWQKVVLGIVIIGVVAFDTLRRSKVDVN